MIWHALLVGASAAVVAVPCAEALNAIARHTFRFLIRRKENV